MTLILSLWTFNSWATSCPVGSSERWYVNGCETGPSTDAGLSACAPLFDPSILTEVGSTYEDLANRIEARLPISGGNYGSYTTSVRSPDARITLYLYGYDVFGSYRILAYTYVNFGSNCVCNRTLNLMGGGDVYVDKTLAGQNVKVLSCSGQPEAEVPVEILATPVDPVLGPSGGLRAVGGSGSGTSALSALTDPNGEIKLEFLPPAVAGTHALTARCTDPNKPCSPNPAPPKEIRVHECPIELSLIGGGQVEPNEPLPNQMLRATNCRGEPVNELAVEIKSSVQANTGGHQHHDNDRPKGTIIASRATTNENGEIPFSFKAPEVAGTHEITARCTDDSKPCNEGGPAMVDVMVGELELVSNLPYEQTGDNDLHPLNHYLRHDALQNLQQFAEAYFEEFDHDKFYLNDASLPWGGLFDVGCVMDADTGKCADPWQHTPWVTPHKTHRCGRAIDVRGNGHPDNTAIPLSRHDEFIKMAGKYGISVLPEGKKQADGTHQGGDNAHYHLWLLGDGEGRKEDKAIVGGTKTCSQLLQ